VCLEWASGVVQVGWGGKVVGLSVVFVWACGKWVE